MDKSLTLTGTHWLWCPLLWHLFSPDDLPFISICKSLTKCHITYDVRGIRSPSPSPFVSLSQSSVSYSLYINFYTESLESDNIVLRHLTHWIYYVWIKECQDLRPLDSSFTVVLTQDHFPGKHLPTVERHTNVPSLSLFLSFVRGTTGGSVEVVLD